MRNLRINQYFFSKGKILLYSEKNYVATISDINLILKIFKDSSEAKLKGKFLDDNIIINFNNIQIIITFCVS